VLGGEGHARMWRSTFWVRAALIFGLLIANRGFADDLFQSAPGPAETSAPQTARPPPANATRHQDRPPPTTAPQSPPPAAEASLAALARVSCWNSKHDDGTGGTLCFSTSGQVTGYSTFHDPDNSSPDRRCQLVTSYTFTGSTVSFDFPLRSITCTAGATTRAGKYICQLSTDALTCIVDAYDDSHSDKYARIFR
jgi:hypothetical protein